MYRSSCESLRPRLRKIIARAGSLGADAPDLPRILMYHGVDDRGGRLSVTPREFEAHLDILVAGNIDVVGVSELHARFMKGDAAHAVALSFDDGFREMYDIVAPLLLSRNMGATFYVITDRLNGGIPNDSRRYMDADEVKRVHEIGFEIGGHTHTHPVLSRIDSERAADEIGICRRRLEKLLGQAPTSFAYPRGDYSLDHIEMVRSAGFANAVTVRPGSLMGNIPRFQLLRTEIAGGDDATTFRLKLAGGIDSWHRVVSAFGDIRRVVARRTP
ncbi:MAG: polysaccharide deacetylase family protein [bacterium]|nr:polysaccharide deacetylase family protein [bacterium]